MRRDLERNVRVAHSRTAGSAARGETCAGEEEKAEWEVGGQPTPPSGWLIGPEAPVPSALTLQPQEAMEGPGVSEVVPAMPINLPSGEDICNLIKMRCCCPF